MARVEFNWPTKGIRKNTGLPFPKRIDSPDSWLAAARKAIPEIPRMGGVDNWEIFAYDATDKYVRFDLKNCLDEKCFVIVDRTKSFIQTN